MRVLPVLVSLLLLAACGGARDQGPATIYFDDAFAAPGTLRDLLATGVDRVAGYRWAVTREGANVLLTFIADQAEPPHAVTFVVREDGGMALLDLASVSVSGPAGAAHAGDRRWWVERVRERLVVPLGGHTVLP
jgi:hypothetical protein